MHYSNETNAYLSQSVSLPSFAVLGQNATFRQGNSRTQLFNPTNSTPPFFQVFHPDFLSVLGKNAFVRQIAVNKTFGSGFAFEAPVFNVPTNEVFFASSVFVPESSFNHSNHISKISMTRVEQEIAAGVPVINVPFETVSLFKRNLYFLFLTQSIAVFLSSSTFRKRFKSQMAVLGLSTDLSYSQLVDAETSRPL